MYYISSIYLLSIFIIYLCSIINLSSIICPLFIFIIYFLSTYLHTIYNLCVAINVYLSFIYLSITVYLHNISSIIYLLSIFIIYFLSSICHQSIYHLSSNSQNKLEPQLLFYVIQSIFSSSGEMNGLKKVNCFISVC